MFEQAITHLLYFLFSFAFGAKNPSAMTSPVAQQSSYSDSSLNILTSDFFLNAALFSSGQNYVITIQLVNKLGIRCQQNKQTWDL